MRAAKAGGDVVVVEGNETMQEILQEVMRPEAKVGIYKPEFGVVQTNYLCISYTNVY